MKTFAVSVTMVWQADDEKSALHNAHEALVSLENNSAMGVGYQGYRLMTAYEEKPE